MTKGPGWPSNLAYNSRQKNESEWADFRPKRVIFVLGNGIPQSVVTNFHARACRRARWFMGIFFMFSVSIVRAREQENARGEGEIEFAFGQGGGAGSLF